MSSILVWTVALSAVPEPLWPRLARLLDDEERAKAARFAFERHRRQHIAAHALKRLMLSAVAPRPPQCWMFETAARGKPRVAPTTGPRFNLSHCDGRVACAVSENVELGVDVEPLSRHAPLELAPRYFAPDEAGWLGSLPPPDRPLGFFRLWTLKEAYIKATGLGMAQELHDFSFGFDPLRVRFSPSLGHAEAWRFEQRLIAGSHVLALAWAGARDASVKIEEVAWGRWPNGSAGLLERAKGFEPSTPTLARLCSTPELHPRPGDPYHAGRGGGCCKGLRRRLALAIVRAPHRDAAMPPRR